MNKIFPYFLLIVLICFAYGNTIHHSFHYDDIPSILEKPWIRGVDKIPDFIFSFTQRPLVILSFNINYAISEFDVWSYHIFNITSHLLVVFLIYRLGQLILSSMGKFDPETSNDLNKMPLVAALIFGLHPLNTQAVTYISGRSSVIATIFYLVTIILFFEGLNKTKKRKLAYMYLLGSLISFVLAFLCKLIVISLPGIIFAYNYYFIYKQDLKSWWQQNWKWVIVVMGPFILAITYKKLYAGEILSASSANIPPLVYFRTQLAVIPFEYFRKMLFPFNLTIDPDFQLLSHWTSILVFSGIITLGIFLIIWIKLSKIKNGSKIYGPEAFGFVWVLITLSPTSSVVPLLDVAVEHRTYLPLVGFSIALASTLVRINIFSQRQIFYGLENILDVKKLPIVSYVFIFMILSAFMVGTKERNKVWKDEVSLWTDAKQKAPLKPRVYNNLGEAFDKLGDYGQAINEFEASLSLNPNYIFALSNLGNVYGKKKEYSKAIGYFKRALQEKPDYAVGHYNLAKAFQMTGYPEKAAKSYRSAIKYNPYFEEAFFNFGFLALELKYFVEAVDSFKKFIVMQPKHSKANFGLGAAYSMIGKHKQARKHYKNAIDHDPQFILPYINLANLYMNKGQTKEAKNLLKKVLLINPDFAGVHKNLGLIFLQENNFNSASQHLNEYLRLMPMAPDTAAIQSILKNNPNNKLH